MAWVVADKYIYLIVGWEWSVFQDQEKHSTEEAYERILW